MPDKLLRHLSWVGIGVYMVSLLTVSCLYRSFALKPLWMAWGVGAVLFFFGLTYLFHRRWCHDDAKRFVRKVFWVALGIRLLYLAGIIFYYYQQTGLSLEYDAADSLNYHRWASYCSNLARQGQFKEIILTLHYNTMGFSDQGYTLYLTILYTLFGKNILGPRILKALMSAYLCVVVYKLAARSLGERTARIAAVMAVFMPHLIHYPGTYLKEMEMVFLATLALERMDYLIRSKRYTFWNIICPIVLTALTFGFRTVVGMALIASFLLFVLFGERQLLTRKTKGIVAGMVVLLAVVFLFTPIGWEMAVIFKLRFSDLGFLSQKYRALGMRYAEFAHCKYLWPGAFVMPLTNLVEVANSTQKMMNGDFFVKNYLAFFAMWGFVVAVRERQWRNITLPGAYTLFYVLIVTFSFAAMSERYHFPELPGFILLSGYAIAHWRRQDFKWLYIYSSLLILAIVAWNTLKLAGRGIIL